MSHMVVSMLTLEERKQFFLICLVSGLLQRGADPITLVPVMLRTLLGRNRSRICELVAPSGRVMFCACAGVSTVCESEGVRVGNE